MATITKKKAKAKGKTKAAAATTEQLVEEYIALDAKVKAAQARLKPHTDRLANLRKQLDEHVDSIIEPEDETVVTGIEHALEFSPKGKATDVTDPKLAAQYLEAVEKGLVLKLVKFGITDLKKYLTPEQVAEVVEEEHRNARRVKVVEL